MRFCGPHSDASDFQNVAARLPLTQTTCDLAYEVAALAMAGGVFERRVLPGGAHSVQF